MMSVPDQTRPVGLSDAKLIAIDTLLTGATHREAAVAAGVERTTVTEWVNRRGEFRSELERRRRKPSTSLLPRLKIQENEKTSARFFGQGWRGSKRVPIRGSRLEPVTPDRLVVVNKIRGTVPGTNRVEDR